jgi:DNA helicase-2/ATP-dependent DNA helicase PcrA
MNNTDLLSSLNPEQKDAVITLDKPLLVLSGAGTGKTKVLTSKIAYIVENGYAFPSQILAVTFSNRAAKEMKERVLNLVNGFDGVWLGTFHSICARILRSYADLIGISREFTIIDSDDQLKIIKQILKEMNVDKKIANGVASKISRWKDKCIKYDDARIDASSLEANVYKIYQERIRSYDSMDFGDLLQYVIQIFRENLEVLEKYRRQFKYILVDEYQDTNMSQYIWLRMLSPAGEGLCCVGDDDQAIYSWRGAEVENILRFEKDFPNTKIVKLERNYRSVGHILGAASSLISKNENRLGKTIWTEGDNGEKVLIQCVYNSFDEAKIVVNWIYQLRSNNSIEYKDMAILLRAGFQTREFEDRLIANGLPYKVVGSLKFYERQEIKDVIAYMRLIYQLNDSLAFERIINVPKRGIGASTISQFHQYSVEKNISLYQAAKEMVQQGMLRASVKDILLSFFSLIESIRENSELTPSEIARAVLNETGYLSILNNEQTLESQGRIENIKELLIALDAYEDLATFIEHVSLVMSFEKNSTDNLISIMTLHSSKGLEFDAVFLAGWEEGIFPHTLSLQEGNLEEERRLAYVGITRAKKYVSITYAMNRKMYNQWQSNMPSRFLSELSTEHVVHKKYKAI